MMKAVMEHEAPVVDRDWQTILRDAGAAVENKRVAAQAKDLGRYREIITTVAEAGGAPTAAQIKELVSLAEALRLPSDALEADVRAVLNHANNQRMLEAKRAESDAIQQQASLAVVERANIFRRLKEIDALLRVAETLPSVTAAMQRDVNAVAEDYPRMFADLQTFAEGMVSR